MLDLRLNLESITVSFRDWQGLTDVSTARFRLRLSELLCMTVFFWFGSLASELSANKSISSPLHGQTSAFLALTERIQQKNRFRYAIRTRGDYPASRGIEDDDAR